MTGRDRVALVLLTIDGLALVILLAWGYLTG